MAKYIKLRNLLLALGTTTMLVAPIALVSCSDKDGGDTQPPIDPGDGGGTQPPTPEPEKKPVINLVNQVINKKITEDLPGGSGVPGFKLGFGTAIWNEMHGPLSNYDLDQVYNFSAKISVDAYKTNYATKGNDWKLYDVPAMETTMNFNFKFNGDQGLLILDGLNPDYHVGIAPPISGGSYEFEGAILSKPLGNSFMSNDTIKPEINQQMQFQVGMGGSHFEGQNIFIWPMSDENVAEKDKFGSLTNLHQEEFNRNQNMSMTYSLTPVK